ncbi:MAG: hypothetical protein KF796_19225 [Ramlibacter sp.]|nr:hypothetical protein [Ramlibacter sp.]
MARKPIELELSGLLTPRERLWAAARKLRTFTLIEWQDATKPVVRIATCETYLRCLLNAGYLAPDLTCTPRRRRGFAERRYQIVKDSYDAPRVARDGQRVAQGATTLAMWRAMQVLKDFDWHDIQRTASMPTGLGHTALTVPEATAKSYVAALARASYFTVVQPAKPGRAARYRLKHNTGAHAPAVTRRKVVFDRNDGQFKYQETAQELVDAIE